MIGGGCDRCCRIARLFFRRIPRPRRRLFAAGPSAGGAAGNADGAAASLRVSLGWDPLRLESARRRRLEVSVIRGSTALTAGTADSRMKEGPSHTMAGTVAAAMATARIGTRRRGLDVGIAAALSSISSNVSDSGLSGAASTRGISRGSSFATPSGSGFATACGISLFAEVDSRSPSPSRRSHIVRRSRPRATRCPKRVLAS